MSPPIPMRPTEYLTSFGAVAGRVRATDGAGAALGLDEAMEQLVNSARTAAGNGGKILFIGNGGSAAIASHQAVDYWKNGGLRAMTFNDASLLTCVSNDYGYPEVFERPVIMFADPGDLLIAISSSGRSLNILKGVEAARARKCGVVTLSGFAADNDLHRLGDLNFYVPSDSYGHVEIIHLMILHCALDLMMGLRAPVSTGDGRTPA